MTDAQPATSAMRATAHPVRLRMLSILTGAAMSAAELARELEITHANASYHLRLLADAGLVVEAGEEKIRGGVAKRFRHPWESTMSDATSPAQEDTELYLRAVAEEM
ncbi:MAG: helix-turn-helix domain-containing protein, partial [Nocardioides sp.]